MPFRKVLFWAHLALGIAAGSVILVMSVTGVLLTYQKQMTQWADRGYWGAPTLPDTRAPLSAMVAAARGYAPEARVTGVTVHADPEAPVAATLSGGRTVYLDPSTAAVRGEGSAAVRGFFRAVTGWHRWFNVTGEGRPLARAVTGWGNLIFVFLVLSGLWLWVPRRFTRRHFLSVMRLDLRARGKARDFNWHHVFGFWMAIPLFVVAASATVISFPWASDLAYRVTGDVPPQRGSRAPTPAPQGGEKQEEEPFDATVLDPLLAPSMAAAGAWRTLTFSVPEHGEATISVRVDGGWGGQPQLRTTLELDAASATVVSSRAFGDGSPGQRLRSWLRFAHTGEWYGLWGQTLAGLASLAGVLLVWSGFALAWRRLLRPLYRRGSSPAASTEDEEALGRAA